MEDPEAFLKHLQGKRVAIDEIHRLANPSELLKIAADHFPKTRIIATGSSTLAATIKFRDTLAGRKSDIWLTPMIRQDIDDFNDESETLDRRLVRGGLPPFYLSDNAESYYQEWIDAYWSRDIQEMFRLEKRAPFQKLLELVLIKSGGIFEATSFAGPCEISRATVSSYLDVLASTKVAHIVKPFSSRKSTEIISAPKVYAFDTGFICYFRGWHSLRDDDRGTLWEHFVLNEIHARVPGATINYWRDKRGHEVDFIISRRGSPTIAVECTWSAGSVDLGNLNIFSKNYPKIERYIVANDATRAFARATDGGSVEIVGLETLVRRLLQKPS